MTAKDPRIEDFTPLERYQDTPARPADMTPANMTPALHFDAAAHTYSVNGVVKPNVTSILEDVGIVDYSAVPAQNRELGLARGRVVHLITQYHVA
jgi:hypothetical protein